MYQVLYRKWRPKNFDDVVGQEHITTTIKNEIETGRIAHAYLFTGVRGTGKTTCAKILSKAVNCLNPKDGNPCGLCSACQAIDKGNAIDVVEIDAASNNGVENVRNIIEETSFTPAELKYRVYIIDEVHMLSTGAFNAFLKTLEEPLEHVIFILATTEIHKIPATILSRCQRFDFNRIPIEKISERLIYISEHENFVLDKKAANLISTLSGGALRDALSILDQCMTSTKKINDDADLKDIITEEDVDNIVGLVNSKDVIELLRYILQQKTTEAIIKISDMYDASKDMTILLHELCEWFRNIMIIKTVKDTKNILDISDGEKEKLRKISEAVSLIDIIFILDLIKNSISYKTASVDNRTLLELVVIKACCRDRMAQEKAVKISSYEQKKSIPNKKIDSSSKNTVKNTTSNMYQDIALNAKEMPQWNKVLKLMAEKSRSMATAFDKSRAFISGDYLLIDAKNDLAFVLLRESKNKNEVRALIAEVTGKTYKLGPYKKLPSTDNSNGDLTNATDPLDQLKDKAENMGITVNNLD